MRKRFRVVSAFLICALTGFLLTGCGGTQSSTADKKVEKKVIKVAIGLNEESPEFKGLQKFKEIVEKDSKGRLEVNIFGNAQLGDDVKAMTQLRAGTLEMSGPSSSPIASLDKKWMVFDLPFLFPNEEVVDKVLDGAIGQKFLDSLSQYGIKGICYYENGYRQLTNSTREIKSPADLKGLKIRTMENPVHLAAFRTMGANPTPMPFSEVFTAMQQKTIDGQENPSTTNYLQKFYEVQKYNTLSNHVYTPFVIMFSQKIWATLPKEDQDIILKAGKESSVYQRQYNREMMKEAVAGMEKNGVVVTRLTPEQQKAFMEATKDIVTQFQAEIGTTTVQEVQAEIAKYAK